MKTLSKAAVLGIGVTVAFGASAALLTTQTRNNNWSFSEASAALNVPLNDAGATTVTFRTTANNQKVILSYTAECGLSDDKNDAWLQLDILVDNVAVRPTNNAVREDAFCSSTANAGFDWKMAAVNAVHVVPFAGIHTVRITADISNGNGGATGWLGDTSLVVWR